LPSETSSSVDIDIKDNWERPVAGFVAQPVTKKSTKNTKNKYDNNRIVIEQLLPDVYLKWFCSDEQDMIGQICTRMDKFLFKIANVALEKII
jgi:hypothetical protein